MKIRLAPWIAVMAMITQGCSWFMTREDKDNIQDAIDAINNTSAELSRQPGAWSGAATRLLDDLDGKHVPLIRRQVEGLVTRATGTVGNEFKCSADFVGARLQQNLQALADGLAGKPSTPPAPSFCQVDPMRVELKAPPDQRVLAFFGYDLDLEKSKVNVYILDESGTKKQITPSRSTHYLLQVDLSDAQFACTSKAIEFAQSDAPPLYAVPIIHRQIRDQSCVNKCHDVYRARVEGNKEKDCFGGYAEHCRYTSIDDCKSKRCDAECDVRKKNNPSGHVAIGDACSTSGAFYKDCHTNFCPGVAKAQTNWCSDTAPLRANCLAEASSDLSVCVDGCAWLKDCRGLRSE